jgi:hypothetical protein
MNTFDKSLTFIDIVNVVNRNERISPSVLTSVATVRTEVGGVPPG